SATVAAGGSQVFTASGADQYGNPASMSATTWTTSDPGGSVSSPGSSTLFTAGNPGSSGTVTATLGGLTDGASVSVTSSPFTNGDFETGSFSGWSVGGGRPTP